MLPADPHSDKQNTEPEKRFWLQLVRYSELAFMFPAALVVGWLLGLLLDRWLHTTWLYMAGILVGIAAGFIHLVRTVLRDSN